MTSIGKEYPTPFSVSKKDATQPLIASPALKPTGIIVIYDNNYEEQITDSYTYLEYQAIQDEKLTAPVPLNRSVMNKIVARVKFDGMEMMATDELIMHRVIYIDTNIASRKVIWVVPPGKASVNLEGTKTEFFFPTRLFMAKGDNLYAYFIKPNQKLSTDVKVYNCTLPNVYENGLMCLGMNKIEHIYDIDRLIKRCMHIFHNAKFNGKRTNAAHKLFSYDEWKITDTFYPDAWFVQPTKIKTIFNVINSK